MNEIYYPYCVKKNSTEHILIWIMSERKKDLFLTNKDGTLFSVKNKDDAKAL